MGSARTVWKAARRHLTPVAEGGLMIPGTPLPQFRTAPLPDGVPVKLWDTCDCDYQPPIVDGKPVPHRADPAWTEWTEDPPKQAGRAAGKRSLRYALSDPRLKSDGGLLGPNGYQLGHFHSGDARFDAPGYPDLTIWSPLGREVWELKIMGEVPTLPQAVTMTSLELAGYTVRLVRPCCLLSGWVDRWLAALSGREPTISPWAPQQSRSELDIARARRSMATPPPARPTLLEQKPATTAAVVDQPARALRAVPDPPGRDLDTTEAAHAGQAAGYLVPMPDTTTDRGAVRALEDWLRAHGFSPADVPWPTRIATAAQLLIVWANTGEPSPQPGTPRPRKWRVVTLQQPVPETVLAQLAADIVYGPTLPAVLGLLQNARPAITIKESL